MLVFSQRGKAVATRSSAQWVGLSSLYSRSSVHRSLPTRTEFRVSFSLALHSQGYLMRDGKCQLAMSLCKGAENLWFLEPLKQEYQVFLKISGHRKPCLFLEGSLGQTPRPAPMVFKHRNLLVLPKFLWIHCTLGQFHQHVLFSREQQPRLWAGSVPRLPASIQQGFPWAWA